MTYYGQPPTWLIVSAIVALAVPASAIFGLAAAKLFDWFYRRRDVAVTKDGLAEKGAQR